MRKAPLASALAGFGGGRDVCKGWKGKGNSVSGSYMLSVCPECPRPGRPLLQAFSFMGWEIQGMDGQEHLQVSEVHISPIPVWLSG